MALARYQERHYHHRVNVWRRGIARVVMGLDGKPTSGSPKWALVYSNVPCHLDTGKGMSVPKELGRADYDIVMTSDEAHFPVDYVIEDADVLKNVTSGDPRNGEFYVVQGEPQKVGEIGRRYTGRKTVTAARLQVPPEGVS